jgi:hypothetical protein
MSDWDVRQVQKVGDFWRREIMSTEEACSSFVFFCVGREPHLAEKYFELVPPDLIVEIRKWLATLPNDRSEWNDYPVLILDGDDESFRQARDECCAGAAAARAYFKNRESLGGVK